MDSICHQTLCHSSLIKSSALILSCFFFLPFLFPHHYLLVTPILQGRFLVFVLCWIAVWLFGGGAELEYHHSAGLPSRRSLENRSLIDEPLILKGITQVPYFFVQRDFLPSEVVPESCHMPNDDSYYIRKGIEASILTRIIRYVKIDYSWNTHCKGMGSKAHTRTKPSWLIPCSPSCSQLHIKSTWGLWSQYLEVGSIPDSLKQDLRGVTWDLAYV